MGFMLPNVFEEVDIACGRIHYYYANIKLKNGRGRLECDLFRLLCSIALMNDRAQFLDQ